ncbi:MULTISPECIES: YcxB family protein [Chitinophagaceae]
MQFSFSYQKNKVIQGLRYHFITRPEIKILILIINIFAIISAALFYLKKIQPQPFILSSFIWVVLLIVFWFLLPWYIYRKSATFKDHFILRTVSSGLELSNERGNVFWSWEQFSSYFESPAFIHLYFNSRSFFMLPKDHMAPEQLNELRTVLKENIQIKK